MAKRTSETNKRTGKTTRNPSTPKPGKRGDKAEGEKGPALLGSEPGKKTPSSAKTATAKTVQKKPARTSAKSRVPTKAAPPSEAEKTSTGSGSRRAVAKKPGANGRAGKANPAPAERAPAKRGTGNAKASKPATPRPATQAKGDNGRPAGVLQAARSVASRSNRIPESPRLRRTRLTPAELAEFREVLLAKRHELVTDMANLEDEARRGRSENGPTSSAMPIHMADIGSDTWEQEFTLNLIEKERTIVREIDEALDRIESKTFGICLATGKSITKARLRAKPWAKYCIEYARKRELGLA